MSELHYVISRKKSQEMNNVPDREDGPWIRSSRVYSEQRKENVQCGTYPPCYFTFGKKNIL